MIFEYYWTVDTKHKNVFIVINEYREIVDRIIKRLTDHNKEIKVDLVILKLPDTIFRPPSDEIQPQSIEAYKYFISNIVPLFEFY